MINDRTSKSDVDDFLTPIPTETIPQLTDKKVTKQRSKRHKPIKSCTFCRKRKLKCDQQKPMCSSCKSREMNECIYSDLIAKATTPSGHRTARTTDAGIKDNLSSDNLVGTMKYHQMKTYDSSSPDKPNSPTTSRISTYEGPSLSAIDHNVTDSVTSSSGSAVDDKIPNPFRNYYYIQCKENGRTITYGPTSLRTFIMRNNWGFKDKYIQLWKKIKVERNIWKKKYMTNIKTELEFMELTIGDSVSILNDVLPCLPDFDSIKGYINEFFDEKNSNYMK